MGIRLDVIAEETAKKIREEAREAGLTPSRWFDYIYGNLPLPTNSKTVFLHIRRDVMPKLAKRAKVNNLSMGKYLLMLMEKEEAGFEANQKLDEVRKIINYQKTLDK